MKNVTLLMGAATTGLLLLAACARVDHVEAVIPTPGVLSSRDVEIITNAAQHQLSAEFPERDHLVEIDVASGTVVYHEGPLLTNQGYLQALAGKLQEAGYPPASMKVVRNPPPPILLSNGTSVYQWQDRHSLVMQVPALRHVTDANRIVDALAVVRQGGRNPRIHYDAALKSVRIDHLDLGRAVPRNYAFAIATAGYPAGPYAANGGDADAIPRWWIPLPLTDDPG